ncbi:hypothetical protein ACQ4PT_044386 [Festuca glaucescens]
MRIPRSRGYPPPPPGLLRHARHGPGTQAGRPRRPYRFLKRRDYYQRIGKAWKRGYLLYGPPGTGKSSLVAAMANYLRFNIYDLDLAGVYDNTCLQRLLVDMSNQSILVIEDIDCSFDTMSRERSKVSESADAEDDDDRDHRTREEPKITLSGLLNFIDGLCTNYKNRLDPALLWPGRMDMHVYMGYCCWEAFRTLAQNYHLVEDHPLFPEIQELLAGGGDTGRGVRDAAEE